MPTPSTRTPVRIARGSYSNLNGSISDLQDGEISYAEDQNKLYIKEGSALVVLTQPAANPVFTGNATFDTNTLYVDGTNNRVGILTTSPGHPLEVVGDIEISGSNGRKLTFAGDGSSQYFKMDTTLNGPIINGYGGLVFEIGAAGSEKARFDSSGRLLVGLTSSVSNTAYLQLKGVNTSDISLYWPADSATGGSQINWRTDGGGTATELGRIYCAQVATGAAGGSMHFMTHNGTSVGERLRIDSSGKIGIGTTSPATLVDIQEGTTGIRFNRNNNTPELQFKANSVDEAGEIRVGESSGGGVMQFHTKTGGGTLTQALQLDTSQNATFAGTVTATSFAGDGSALTGIETGGDPVRQAQYTSSASYTVPAGVTTIRAYAVGAGGNGGNNKQQTTGTYHQTSGAGGGMAYGDFTVTPGQTVTITISNRIATVSYGGTTLLTANPGAHATDGGTNNAAGGTATKHSSVANGGAYSGGLGGYLATAGTACGGASAGSPLGNGSKAAKGGGAGIGAGGGTWNSYGGGGAGSGGTGSGTDYVSGGSGPDCKGRDGARYALYTDPLLKNCVMPGEPGHIGYTVSPPHYYYSECPTGVGGWIVQSISPYSFWTAGNGGSFAGGGSNGVNVSGSQPNAAGDGGILAGGGSAGGNSGEYWPGNGGYGGGGGAGQTTSGTIQQRGQGGSAVVWIFHT